MDYRLIGGNKIIDQSDDSAIVAIVLLHYRFSYLTNSQPELLSQACISKKLVTVALLQQQRSIARGSPRPTPKRRPTALTQLGSRTYSSYDADLVGT